MSQGEVETLRVSTLALVRARHGSVYKATQVLGPLGLPRATIYQTLSGRYAGNLARQLARIRSALGETPKPVRPPLLSAEALYEALKAAACARCAAPNSARCSACDGLFQAQAAAVDRLFASPETLGEKA